MYIPFLISIPLNSEIQETKKKKSILKIKKYLKEHKNARICQKYFKIPSVFIDVSANERVWLLPNAVKGKRSSRALAF